MDNPHWPNGSAVERAKDSAANLAPPKVTGAEWTLTEHDIECLAAGAGILASGGGGNPKHGFNIAKEILKQGKRIKVVNPCRIDAKEMGLVCSVALMGDPMADNDGSDGSQLALKRMQQVIISEGKYNASKAPLFSSYVAKEDDLKSIGVEDIPNLTKKITALTPVETGGVNTVEPLIVSAKNGLPCLDAAGQGRSYPKLQMFMPFIYGGHYCPAVLADSKKQTVTCVAADSCEDLENFFRNETVAMGSLSSIAMGPLLFEEVFQKMVLFATSRAWQLGRAVDRAMKKKSSFLDAVVDQEQGYVLVTGKVTEVETRSGGGFTENITIVEGADEYKGNTVRVTAKNENYVAEKLDSSGSKEDTLATIPDIITIVYLEATQPLDVAVMAGNNEIKGKKVAVVVLPTDPRLYTEKALKVMGPRALGLDVDYEEPKFLNNSEDEKQWTQYVVIRNTEVKKAPGANLFYCVLEDGLELSV